MKKRLLLLLLISGGAIFMAGSIQFFAHNTAAEERAYAWQSIGPGGGGWLVDVEYASATNKLYAALDCGGVRISKNGGKHWELSTQGIDSFYGSEIEDVMIHPSAPSLVFMAAWTGIYRSVDAGSTWIKVHATGDGTSLRVNTFAVDASDDNVIYAGSGTTRKSLGFVNVEGNTDAPGVLWRSSDRGLTWHEIFKTEKHLSIYSVVTLAGNKKTSSAILLFTNKGMWKSYDGGKSFIQLHNGLPENQRQAVQSDINKKLVWAAVMYDGIYRSADFGETWTRIGPDEKHSFVHLAYDPNNDMRHPHTLLVSAQDWFGVGGVWEVRNADVKPIWRKIYPDGTQIARGWNTYEADSAGAVTIGYPHGRRTFYLSAPGAKLLQSTDGGSTWTSLHTTEQSANTWRGNGFELMILAGGAIDPADGALYFSYIDMGTFKSADGGQSWRQLFAGGHFAGGNPETIAVNPMSSEVLISLESGKVIASNDKGNTFKETLPHVAYDFAFDRWANVFAATDKGILMRGYSGKWSLIGQELPYAHSIIYMHGLLMAANHEGVWQLEGSKWQRIVSLKDIIPNGIRMHPASDILIIATSHGIYRRGADYALTRVREHGWEAITSTGAVVYAKNRSDGIWRSTDFGITWEQITGDAYQDGFERGLVSDPLKAGRVYYGSKCMGVFTADLSDSAPK